MMDFGDVVYGILIILFVAVIVWATSELVVSIQTDSSHESSLRCELEGYSRSNIIDKRDEYNKPDDVVLCYSLTGETMIIGE